VNRRSFLKLVGVAAMLGPGRAWTTPANAIPRVGLQLYTVRRSMQHDFDGTLSKVAEVGYREVELAGNFGHTPKEVKASLGRAGLIAPSSHVDYNTLGDQWASTLEGAKIIGQQYIVCPSIDEKVRQAPGGWQRAAETLNRAGEAAKKAGIQFAYHNHWFEFQPSGGKLPYDILLEQTDPHLVKMEMDIFWLTKGGSDPRVYFHRYPGRFPMVHVKGRDRNGEMSEVAADNSIDWRAIFALSQEAGIQHYFVEHDDPKDEFGSIRASFNYLRELTF